jgi:gamma-glutamyltranspeptidase/glutathione hydrolase
MTRWKFALTVSTALLLVGLGFAPTTVAQRSGAAEKPRTSNRPSVPGVHGLVTSGHPLASMAGMQVLLKGGNAIDASVAVLATLNVVRPQSSGAAGNGFFTIYDKASGQVYSLGATGAAPLKLDPEKMTSATLYRGILAGKVPGLFGGWVAALDRFGTMGLGEVLGQAIDYAENGHPIEASVARSIGGMKDLFEKYPSSRAMFLPGGRVPEPDEMFKMPNLAATFKKVVEAERKALDDGKSRSEALQAAFDRFYKGDIADEMARFYKNNKGLFTKDDFKAYQPIWADPVHTRYRGYDVYSSPSTSRGGLEVVMQLNLIEGFDVAKSGHNTPRTLHLVAESIKLAKADIYHFVADPKFTEMPTAGMLSKEYAARRRAFIKPGQAGPYLQAGAPPGAAQATATKKALRASQRPRLSERSKPGSTDSFSVVDKFGNAVACTPTHGSGFGTGVVVGNTGLTFNNGTRHGSTSPYPDDVNYVRGGQIAILNNSPIIVLKDGKFVLALGTPGGETIGQTQFQVLLNVLDFGMSIQDAIAAPRVALVADPNFYKPGAAIQVRVENRISEDVVRQLKAMGHNAELIGGHSLGSMQGILVNQKTGSMAAGADPRRVAYAVGW